MANKETFLANVVDLEARRAAEAVWQTYDDAWRALDKACDDAGIDWTNEEAINALDGGRALKDAADAAHNAWCDVEGYDDPITDDDDDAVRCALTGLLIHDGDPFLFDDVTGERVLKSALGVPLNIDGSGEFMLDGEA